MKKTNEKEQSIRRNYRGSSKLLNKSSIITGGDSGIGRAVALHFAKEGAHVAVVYNKSDDDASITAKWVEELDRKCLLFKGDVKDEKFCKKVVKQTHKHFNELSILVNNAGTHEPDDNFEDITAKQFRNTFEVNMFSYYYFSHEVIKYLKKGDTIINTTSVTAYRGSDHLIDYAASKGAIVSFTRSLAKNLASSGIRVNGVAPGPVWTPLIYTSFDKAHLEKFGKQTPMKRAGYPYEIAPAYVFLAGEDSSYITGQIIHINGGEVVGG